MMLLRRIVSVFLFAVGWFAVAAGATPAAEIRDEEYGYSLTMPSFPSLGAREVYQRWSFLAPADGDFSANVNLQIHTFKTTRDEFIAQSEAQFAKDKFRINSKTLREVDGRPAVVFDYEWEANSVALRFLCLAVVEAERVLLVTCTSKSAAFDKYEPEFKKAIDSFRLKK